MSSIARAISVASCLAVASAAVLDMPIIVDNGYKSVNFDIGTPAKTFRLLFDTGSSSSWAVDGTCDATACPNNSGYDRVGYNINESSTGNYTGASADIAYLGGDTAGPTVSEIWKVGDTEWRQSFIAANESNWFALAADGFMGLGFSSIIDGGANTVMETLMAAGKVDQAKFGIYYGTELKNTSGKAGDGVLTLGGSKESEYVDGDIIKVPVTRISPGYYDVWRTSFQGVTGNRTLANGTVVSTLTNMDFGRVVFDTGAGSITIPEAENIKIYESIGMNYTAILKGQHIPLCSEFNSTWSVSFTVGSYNAGKVLTLRGDQLRRPGFANRDDACWPPFEGGSTRGFSLIGTPWLVNFYTVWDYGTTANQTDISKFNPTLSFGKLKEGKEPINK